MKIDFNKRLYAVTNIFILYCFAFSTGMLHAGQNVEKVLTLDESINLAIANSQQLMSEQMDVKISGQRLKEAKSGMYPQLEFNTNFSRFEAESPLFISPILGNTILPSKTDPNISKIENYYTAKMSFYQVLWSAGKLSATKKYAETELKTAESNYETIRNSTVANVKKSFFRLLAIQQKLDACNAALKEISELKIENTDIKNRLKSKRIIGKIDTTADNIKKDLELERVDFLDSIGAELDTTFTVVGNLAFEQKNIDLNKCLAWAVEYRPELKKLELQEQMDALEVSLSLSGRYPTIAIGGIYQLEDTQLPFDRKSWNATVNLNLPVFDGFALASRIKQKKYQYRKVQIYRASVIDNIKAEVRKLYLEYDYAVKHLVKKTSDYESMPGINNETFRNMPAYDIIEVKEILLDAKLEYIDATKNAIITKIELENTVGKNID